MSTELSRQASATASALPATLTMFKIYRNPEPAFNSVAWAKTANATGILSYYCY